MSYALSSVENDILEIIKTRVGEANAIKDTEIRTLIEVPDGDKKKPTAGLRQIINSLRSKEYPICSGTSGYWWAKDEKELYFNLEALNGRALKIMSAVKGMRAALDTMNHRNQTKLI